LNIDSDYRLVGTGLLAICIIFIQYLISIEKPDLLQTTSLVLFSIAIPFLAFYIFFARTKSKPQLPVSIYLVKILEATFIIGSICTDLGITFTLAHTSFVAAIAFQLSCFFVMTLIISIFKDFLEAVRRATNEAELEIKDLKAEISKLLLEHGQLELELRKLESEQDKTIETPSEEEK
jgi:hypothetical protein